MEEPRAVLVRSIKTFEQLASSVEDWQNGKDNYKQYCLHFYAPLLNILGQAVAVALIYGLNDNSESD